MIRVIALLALLPVVVLAQSIPKPPRTGTNNAGVPNSVYGGSDILGASGSKLALDGGVARVTSNAALKALASGVFPTVYRAGFAAAGDGGGAMYHWSKASCSIGSGAGDNGAQVAPTSGNGCWTMQPASITDIRVWGAKPDNATDIGAPIQAAYNANVGCIYVPSGTWLWSTAVTMSAQPPCIRGSGWNEAVLATPKTGTWVHITASTFTPVTVTASTGQGGTNGFSNIAFYQDQPAPAPGWAPVVYPAIFNVLNNPGRIDFHNLMFWNTTHCINIYSSGRAHITSIYGQPSGTCIQVDLAQDILQISSIEFWPFWSDDVNVTAYQQQNVDPILMLRADSPTLDNIFALSYHSTVAFGQSGSGITTGAQLGSIQGDANKYAIWVRPATTGVQIQVSNLRGAGQGFPGTAPIAGSETFRDEGTATITSIANLDCFYAGSACVHVTGNGVLQINNAVLWNFNNDNNGSSGIDAGVSGFVVLANTPSVANLTHGGGTIPAASAGGTYALHGVRQYWTPKIVAAGTAGTLTYASQLGQFWYDGSSLSTTFYINVSASSGLTGSVTIQGLPFSLTFATGQHGYCSIGSMSGITLTTGYATISGVAAAAPPNQILLIESGSGEPSMALPASTLGSAFVVEGSCTLAAGQ